MAYLKRLKENLDNLHFIILMSDLNFKPEFKNEIIPTLDVFDYIPKEDLYTMTFNYINDHSEEHLTKELNECLCKCEFYRNIVNYMPYIVKRIMACFGGA